MKTVKLIFLGLFLSLTALAQNDADGITVCHTSATDKFALFASNKDFNMAHPDPLPYVHQSEVGKMNLNCDVLNIWPTQDQWINKDVTVKFEAAMKAAEKK